MRHLTPSFIGSILGDMEHGDNMENRLMTSGEAATYLDVSRQQIHRLVQAGKLRAERAGDFLLFEREELDKYRATPKNKGGRPKEEAETSARATLA